MGIRDCGAFYRHEKAVELAWGIVHENDEFSYELGTGASLKHKPALKDRGSPIAYWVMAKLNNGGKPFAVMSYDDCKAHGLKHSKSVDKNWEFPTVQPLGHVV